MHKPQFLTLCLLLSIYCCLASNNKTGPQGQDYGSLPCQIQSMNAQEPALRIEADAGATEYWNYHEQHFQCVSVAVWRTTIQPRGLLLHHYINGPTLVYVIKGRGMAGVSISSCPEPYLSSQEFSQARGRGYESESFHDQHQQIHNFQEGDVFALPAGVAHWCYNDGQEELVFVRVEHTSDPKKFMFAGNPQPKQLGPGRYRAGTGSQPSQHLGNVFRGIDTQLLAQVFGVSQETARRLQGLDDHRGHIVRVEGELQFMNIKLEREQGEKGSQWSIFNENGLEETICSMRLVSNINDSSHADVFVPRAGWMKTLNSYSMPILKYLHLSATKGVLYKNAINAPHWIQNAHSLVYAVKGEATVQIVDQRGQSLFNDIILEGQLIVVPQYFSLVMQASNQGFEWVTFNTNDIALIQPLVGATSAIQAMPVDVLANIYQISHEEARRLKTNRQEASTLFEPSPRAQRVDV